MAHDIYVKTMWVLLVWAVATASAAARRPIGSSDSIREIINMDHVERILAARRHQIEPPQKNDLYDDLEEEQPYQYRADYRTDFNRSVEIPPSTEFRKILKSSKNALLITKKEYLKDDWCKTEPLKQRVREEGCLQATVLNNFCYGQCNSFYIPRGPKRRPRGATLERMEEEERAAAFKSCSFCRPKKTMWVSVTLRCPSLTPPIRRRKVLRIMQCKCMSVNVN